MALKIKKVELDIFGKKMVILAKDVREIGLMGPGLVGVDIGDGVVKTYSCDWELTQEEVPDLVDTSGLVVNDG
jgi:hypothetical protein